MSAAKQMVAVVDAMLFIDRERVCESLLSHVRTRVLLDEVRSRYDDVDDANDVVKFCREVFELECALIEDTEAVESRTPVNASAAA